MNTVNRADIVLLALAQLGAAMKAVDTEDIAMRTHQLSPGSFSWKKYPDQINLELIRVVLSNMKKPDYGKLASGSGRRGWRLTAAGLARADSIDKTAALSTSPGTAGSIDTVRSERERKRIENSVIYRKWVSGDKAGISDDEIKNLLRVSQYSSKAFLEIKFVRLREMVRGRALLEDFLSFVWEQVQEKLRE